MGYVSFDKEGAELLFNMISTRTGDKTTIITTNLPFTRWEENIKDKVLFVLLWLTGFATKPSWLT